MEACSFETRLDFHKEAGREVGRAASNALHKLFFQRDCKNVRQKDNKNKKTKTKDKEKDKRQRKGQRQRQNQRQIQRQVGRGCQQCFAQTFLSTRL